MKPHTMAVSNVHKHSFRYRQMLTKISVSLWYFFNTVILLGIGQEYCLLISCLLLALTGIATVNCVCTGFLQVVIHCSVSLVLRILIKA